MSSELARMSRFLSLILRHEPEAIGLTLDEGGWADVDELIRLSTLRGNPFTRAQLEQVVAQNDKQRFSFDAGGTRIRANQGHSLAVDLALPLAKPPTWLYHGTATRLLEPIRAEGLLPGSRRHVHLSPDVTTATAVGRRHGRPVVLKVRARDMFLAGHGFFLSANGVWLTARVPVEYLVFPAE